MHFVTLATGDPSAADNLVRAVDRAGYPAVSYPHGTEWRVSFIAPLGVVNLLLASADARVSP